MDTPFFAQRLFPIKGTHGEQGSLGPRVPATAREVRGCRFRRGNGKTNTNGKDPSLAASRASPHPPQTHEDPAEQKRGAAGLHASVFQNASLFPIFKYRPLLHTTLLWVIVFIHAYYPSIQTSSVYVTVKTRKIKIIVDLTLLIYIKA